MTVYRIQAKLVTWFFRGKPDIGGQAFQVYSTLIDSWRSWVQSLSYEEKHVMRKTRWLLHQGHFSRSQSILHSTLWQRRRGHSVSRPKKHLTLSSALCLIASLDLCQRHSNALSNGLLKSTVILGFVRESFAHSDVTHNSTPKTFCHHRTN